MFLYWIYGFEYLYNSTTLYPFPAKGYRKVKYPHRDNKLRCALAERKAEEEKTPPTRQKTVFD